MWNLLWEFVFEHSLITMHVIPHSLCVCREKNFKFPRPWTMFMCQMKHRKGDNNRGKRMSKLNYCTKIEIIECSHSETRKFFECKFNLQIVMISFISFWEQNTHSFNEKDANKLNFAVWSKGNCRLGHEDLCSSQREEHKISFYVPRGITYTVFFAALILETCVLAN